MVHGKTTPQQTGSTPRIWEDTDGVVDAFVAGVGTGGTITGVGEYLKEKNKNIEIIAVTISPVINPARIKKNPVNNSFFRIVNRSFINKFANKRMIITSYDFLKLAFDFQDLLFHKEKAKAEKQ